MARFTFALALLVLAAASSDKCVPTPKACSGTCTITPDTPVKGGTLDVSVNGACPTTNVTTATYDLNIVFGGLPVVSQKGVDGCSTHTFNLPLNMGSMTINGAKCPIPAGTALILTASAAIGKLAPSGSLVAKIETYNQAKTELFDVEVDVTI
jgi:hypothetical protein